MAGEPFGQWLRARRERLGLTLRQVEEITGGRLSNAYLSQLEKGRIESPSIAKVHMLAGALGLDFAEACKRACVDERPIAPPLCPTCGRAWIGGDHGR